MDIDAQNAQLGNVNDEQKQQILAQRNILGGIIKKGNPLHKNVLNVIILLVLLPYMILVLCYKGGKSLIKYTIKSLKRFIQWSKDQVELIVYWTIDKSIKFQNAFFEGTIKGYFLMLWLLDKMIVKSKKYFEIVIIKPLQFLTLKICDWAVITQQYAIYYSIVINQRIIKPLKHQIKLFWQWLKDLLFRLGEYMYETILWEFIIPRSIMIGNKISEFSIILWRKILIYSIQGSIYTYMKLEILCFFLSEKITIISKFIYKWGSEFSKYLSRQIIKLYDWIVKRIIDLQNFAKYLGKQLVKFYRWIKEIIIDTSIKIIDYITKEYLLFKNNVASPITAWIKRILRIIYDKFLNICIWLTEKIRAAFMYIKLTLIPYFKNTLWNYWVLGKNDSWLVYTYVWERVQKIFNKLKTFFGKCKQCALKCSEYIKFHAKRFCSFVNRVKKQICASIKYIAIKIKETIKIFYKKTKYCAKVTKDFVIRLGKLTWRIMKQIMRLTLNFIYLLIEKFCKLIIRVFIPILKTLIFLDKIIDFTSCILFAVLNWPIRVRDKIVDVSLEYICIKLPALIYKIAIFIWRIIVRTFEIITYTVNLIKKQTKKVARIIHNKIIIPIVDFIKAVYNFTKSMILYCKEKVINFKDMIKYDYILPAWAVIRLFCVAQKTRIVNFALICKEAWIELRIRMKHNHELRKIRIRQFIATVKNQINEVKQVLMEPIKQAILFVKQKFISLKNQIIEVAQKIKQIIIDIGNSIKQAFLGVLKIIKEQLIEVAQFLKQQITQIRDYVKGVLTQFAQSIRESLYEIINVMKQQMIQIRNSLQQQLGVMKEYCNDVINAIKISIQQTQASLKIQITQSKQALMIYKDEITNSIVQTWSSIMKKFI